MQAIGTPWAKAASEVAVWLNVDPKRGLDTEQARIRLEQQGRNVLKEHRKTSVRIRIWSQLKSPVVLTLVFATILSAIIGDLIDAAAILFIVFINAFIGYFQESKAESAIDALKKMSTPKTRVLRNGQVSEVSSSDVCMGEILIFEAGDYVAADGRVFVANQLSVDESALTGESIPSRKTIESVQKNVQLGERSNMIFAGTAIATGSGRAIVTATSYQTELGRIANLLESSYTPETPLITRLKKVSTRLLYICAAIVAVISAFGFIRGEPWFDIVMSAVSLAIAAIPEGLPTVVTLALALSVRRMAKRRAIVRHLPAVETLGSTDVICTDKTGTLTTGKMRTREVIQAKTVSMEQLVESAALCCNAAINTNGITGDPTEVALLYLALDHHVDPSILHNKNPRVAEWSFDSTRKRMSVATVHGTQIAIHVKGAPEAMLPLCHLNEADRQSYTQAVDELSRQGRRLLVVASRLIDVSGHEFQKQVPLESSSVEHDLEFLGIVAIADPPRSESIAAISECKMAGIRVVMITGDHPATGEAVARELGIIEPVRFERVITGQELDQMSSEELARLVETVAVYARVSPEHKLKIVQAWKNKGHVVAMTGDGVNDAPALREASIGIAMGKGGTEVARQASSMILIDDNFATIVSAIEEGRAIFGNIKRTIQYLMSGNLAEILVMFGALLLGWPAPFAPIHLLWINLVTDGFPALALGAEPVPAKILSETGRPSGQFFDKHFYRELVLIAGTTTLMTLFIYAYALRFEDEVTAKTYAFSFLVFAELSRSFASRSENKTIWQLGVFSNPYHLAAVIFPLGFQLVLYQLTFFQNVFDVRAIGLVESITLLGFTFIPVFVLEIRKYIKQLRRKNESTRL